MAEGLTNQEIASRLGLSERTAALHVGNVLSKLGAKTRTEAVTLAARSGLLDLGS
jgi:DNA-binding NarL/FixJ family response regulator